jgi:hypothetical protein
VLAYYEQLITASDTARAAKRAPGKRRLARVRHLFRIPRRPKKSARPGEANE